MWPEMHQQEAETRQTMVHDHQKTGKLYRHIDSSTTSTLPTLPTLNDSGFGGIDHHTAVISAIPT